MAATADGSVSTLDRVMPRYDVRTVHETWLPTGPEAAFDALMKLTGKEIRLLGPLEAIRVLPQGRRGQRGVPAMSGSILEAYRRTGFVDLGGRPGAEIVLGAVGRFWSLYRNAPLRTIRSREDFLSFAEPGFSKAAMSFLVEPAGAGSRFVTETRVVGTDERARRLFLRYWFIIGWASRAIRRSWLKALRRRLAPCSRGYCRSEG